MLANSNMQGQLVSSLSEYLCQTLVAATQKLSLKP